MDDIVTRLRQFGDSYGLDTEAADEIERLRKQNKWLASRIGALKIENREIRNKEKQQ